MKTDPFLLFELLVFSFSLGTGLGLGHDLLLFLNRVVINIRPTPHTPKPIIQSICQMIQDLLFCFAAGSILTVILFYYNEGRLRGFAMIALSLGFFAYRKSLGRLCQYLSLRFSQKLGHGIYLGFSYLITPIVRFFAWGSQMMVRPLRYCQKKISERNIMKYNAMRTEQLRKISKEGFVNI